MRKAGKHSSARKRRKTSEPLVALVNRLLPLYAAYKAAHRTLNTAYEKEQRLGHHRAPVSYFGPGGNLQAYVHKGDVSTIERYYDKCLTEAETPAQRAHLRERRAMAIKEGARCWKEWDRLHRDLGLYKLEANARAAEKALVGIEETVLSSKAATPEEVAAMIRVAIACGWDDGFASDDQPPEIRALRGALAYFGQEGGAA